MCLFGGGSATDGGGGSAQANEDARQARIAEGQDAIDRQFSQFDDPFYKGIADSYRRYQTPGFDRQSADAREQLDFGLARSGIQNSSAAEKARSDLDFQVGTQRQSIEDMAQKAANDQRTQIVNARSGITSQLMADADAGSAASGAAARAATLSVNPTFNPLGTLFQNVTGALSAVGRGEGLFSTPNGGVGVNGPSSYGGQAPALFNSSPSATYRR